MKKTKAHFFCVNFSVGSYRPIFLTNNRGDFVNDKFNIEKLEEKIEKLDQNINKLCSENKTFTQTEINCKNIFQENMLKTVSDLIRALCHEMNQPLQAITGYSDLIKLDSKVNISIKEDIKQIRDQIDKANIINKKIVALAKYIN